jgi:hypothetical protein
MSHSSNSAWLILRGSLDIALFSNKPAVPTVRKYIASSKMIVESGTRTVLSKNQFKKNGRKDRNPVLKSHVSTTI